MYLIVWSAKKILKVKIKKLWKQKNGSVMLLSNCAVCGRKNSILFMEQDVRGLGLKTPLSKIPLVVPILI